jgi:diguanylate cyclase (GGDEF)-like protein/PAS domain S-box-containing protein
MNQAENHSTIKSLEALFKNSLDAIVYVDTDFCVVDINQPFENLFGYRLEEIRGKDLDDLMEQGRAGTANRDATAIILTGIHTDTEGIRYNKAGQPINVLIKGIPVFIDGKISGVYGIYSNITERVAAEQALRNSEKELREAQQIARLGRWELDLVNNHLKWTPVIFEIFEVDPDKFKASYESFISTIHPDDRQMVDQSYKQSLIDRQPYNVEHRLLMKDGRIKWVNEICRTDFDTRGQAVRSYGIVQDISDSKAVSEALRAELDKYQAIIATTMDGFWILDLKSRFLEVNDAYCDMIGYSRKELLSMAVTDIEVIEKPEDTYKHAAKIAREGFDRFESKHRRKDGQIIDLEISVSYLQSGDGLLIAFLRDITDRKIAQEQLHFLSLHDNLTGVYNRNYLNQEMTRLDTERQLPISIIMADLNGLKLINDTYGHQFGDKILSSASQVITGNCRQEDIVSRWGGDEFVILLPQTSTEEALNLSKRIIDSCQDVSLEDVPVSMALGVATKTDPQQSLVDILKEAEDSMYKQKLTESRSTKNAVLKALLKTLEAKSFETEQHTRRMQQVAKQIGKIINLPDTEVNRLELLITLHDIGKINLSEEILTKDGPLKDDEWSEVRKHPETGFRIARATEEFSHVADDILAHHERWDGRGYPQGLQGNDIPLLARITAIADAFEVMTNGRPYKKALSPDEVSDEFKRCSGTQFDPELVKIFLSIREDK